MGDDGFEDFVADGGEDALVVVEAEGLDLGIMLADGNSMGYMHEELSISTGVIEKENLL